MAVVRLRARDGNGIGVVRQSWVELLYLSGVVTGTYASFEQDPGAAMPAWLDVFEVGEPYEPHEVGPIITSVQPTRSPAFIPPPDKPTPTMVVQG